jgi:hypothetical protein
MPCTCSVAALYVGKMFLTGRVTRGPNLTSLLAPRGEICPLHRWSVHSFVHPHPGVNTLYCLEEWMGEQRISLPGDNFTP